MGTKSVLSQIGNTPLVRLKQASELTGCNIYGKAEYFNPGESAGMLEGSNAIGILNLTDLTAERIFF